MLKLSAEEINAAKTLKGGWTRDTLAGWGISWPPPKGWRKALIAGVPMSEADSLADTEPAPRVSTPDSLEAQLLREVVMALNSDGMGHYLADLPEVVAYFGGKMPTVAEVIGGRPKSAIITGGITFDDTVWNFSCARRAG